MSIFTSFVAKATVIALAASSTVSAQKILKGSYIVEFVDNSNANSETLLNDIRSQGIAATPRETLNHALFKGASFKLTAGDSVDHIATISNLPAVKQIWPVRLYDRPVLVPQTVGGLESHRGPPPEKSNSKRSIKDDFSPHVMTGVDKLHDLGYTGSGLFIGIVDTGVDYLHPALGGGFGPGFKIATGYDLVGDDYRGGEKNAVPDNDPMDCAGHGTHVSGIVGADSNNPMGFTGVAPNATIGMWKVFGCKGSAGSDILIKAFNMAYEAGVDVISASIGGAQGWTEEAWNVAVERIAEKGTPCIISNGNDGDAGLFYSSSPAESIGAIGVGSIDNSMVPALTTPSTYTVDDGAKMPFGIADSTTNGDFGNTIAPVYAPTLDPNVKADGCSPFTAPGIDLSTYVVLIKRGECTFDEKIANAIAIGAKRVLFYNNKLTGASQPSNDDGTIPAGMVPLALGTSWIKALQAKSKLVVEFKSSASAGKIYNITTNDFSAGKMSTFSTWGMTFENWVKPEVSAPGGLILSTYPRSKGSYAVLSGTSMSAPFIAGVVALIKQVRGKTGLTPAQIGALLASTATPVQFNDGNVTSSFLTPVAQQGGGLVNAYDAALTQTIVNFDNIALNDTAHFKGTHELVITNTGKTPLTYKFAHQSAASAYTLKSGSIIPAEFDQLEFDASHVATVSFEPSTLSVPANGQGKVVAKFKQPTGLDTTRFPVYSGFLQVNGSNGDSLSIPYSGLAASSKDFKIMNTEGGFPFLSTNITPNITETGNRTFVFSRPPNDNDTLPNININLAIGCRIFRIDAAPVGNTTALRTKEILGLKTIGGIAGFPAYQGTPRANDFNVTWDGSLDDGNYAPAGRYKLVLRTLKVFGDQDKVEDYESYELGPVAIRYV